MMSGPNEQKPEENKGRVRIDNLPQQETEVKEREAANVKGGGAGGGGVIGSNKTLVRSVGEEIPQ